MVMAFLSMTVTNLFSQNVNVGPVVPATYPNLASAFAAINAGTHGAGAIAVTIVANTIEPPTGAVLNGGVFASLTVMPTTNVFVGGKVAGAVGVITLNGADNVTIDGRIGGTGSTISLTIELDSSGNCVRMQNGATNNILRYTNCHGRTNQGTLINVAQSLAATGGNNNNTIEFNVTKRGIRGIQTFGTATLFTNDNTIIKNNKVKNFSAIGIFMGSQLVNTDCLDNEVFFDSAATVQASTTCIQTQGSGVTNIMRNRIYGTENAVGPTTNWRGMITLPASNSPLPNPATTTVNIFNNSVALFPTNTTGVLTLGIQTQFSAATTSLGYTVNTYNNTCVIGGTTSAATGALTECIFGNVVTPIGAQTYVNNLFNNISNNRRFGGSATAFHLGQGIDSTSNLTTNADYNLAFALDSVRGFAAEFGSFAYRNSAIEAYKRATCPFNIEQHTAFKDVNFQTTTSNLALGLVGGDLCGLPTALVPTDINGVPRSANYPYKGAYEGPALKVLTLGARLEGVNTTQNVTVALVNASCGIASTGSSDLISGSGNFCFGDSITNGTPYYIDVRSKSHIETYSATLLSFTANALTYDFKTAASQAFGSNQVNDGGVFAFYGGDVNQNGNVDGTDAALIDNDASNFVLGCNVTTDVNNNGFVDGTDAAITDNNAFNFVISVTPCPPGPTSPVIINNTENKQSSILKNNAVLEAAPF